MINVGISLVSLFFGVFYPNPGSILGYAGAISGFLMIYLIPVMTYLKMKKVEIENPLLAAAIQENEIRFMIPEKRSTLPRDFSQVSQSPNHKS